eukprot:1008753-Prymnesium_polylepis.2
MPDLGDTHVGRGGRRLRAAHGAATAQPHISCRLCESVDFSASSTPPAPAGSAGLLPCVYSASSVCTADLSTLTHPEQ